MRSNTMKRGCVFLSLFLMMMVVDMSSATTATAPFSWSDCGVQLNKDIHYQSASISPGTATGGQSLSINVQATISDKVVNADTRLMVWKDGQLFTDVYIQDLCTIISSTNALSCPLEEGKVSFTYEFNDVPTLVSGVYVIQIKNYDTTSIPSGPQEIGCIQFTGTVSGAKGNVNGDKCQFQSTFSSQIKGDAQYTNATRAYRKKGDLIQIGPIGKLNTTGAAAQYGTFIGDFMLSDDLGGNLGSTPYTWALNGSLQSHTPVASTNGFIDNYVGTFTVFYYDKNAGTTTASYFGSFNWTFDWDSTRELVTGTMSLDPTYYYYPNQQFTWPVIVGNFGVFKVRTLANSNYIVEGTRTYCTCGVDLCGVCNGNNKSCGLGAHAHNDNGWGSRKIAAVVCGGVGFLLLILVVDLTRRIRREKRKVPIDDQDLLDHPEKPDYGTMAIDDAIREGERVIV